MQGQTLAYLNAADKKQGTANKYMYCSTAPL